MGRIRDIGRAALDVARAAAGSPRDRLATFVPTGPDRRNQSPIRTVNRDRTLQASTAPPGARQQWELHRVREESRDLFLRSPIWGGYVRYTRIQAIGNDLSRLTWDRFDDEAKTRLAPVIARIRRDWNSFQMIRGVGGKGETLHQLAGQTLHHVLVDGDCFVTRREADGRMVYDLHPGDALAETSYNVGPRRLAAAPARRRNRRVREADGVLVRLRRAGRALELGLSRALRIRLRSAPDIGRAGLACPGPQRRGDGGARLAAMHPGRRGHRAPRRVVFGARAQRDDPRVRRDSARAGRVPRQSGRDGRRDRIVRGPRGRGEPRSRGGHRPGRRRGQALPGDGDPRRIPAGARAGVQGQRNYDGRAHVPGGDGDRDARAPGVRRAPDDAGDAARRLPLAVVLGRAARPHTGAPGHRRPADDPDPPAIRSGFPRLPHRAMGRAGCPVPGRRSCRPTSTRFGRPRFSCGGTR